ncbi:MAG: carboxypeptidase regulatory-like domain-containing protein [Candidatus Dadabacteria bacterium]|nr:carboxypeptidase regulatory-like domain-containing protein [Candidatus Dadabacteria bacterium]
MRNLRQTFMIPLVSVLTFFIVNITNFPEDALSNDRVSSTTETNWGLHTTTFTTPEGKIKVNFPDDMAAGDTISGTVIAEPSGATLEERERNSDELNGYVVEVEAEDKTVKEASVKTKLLTGVAIPAGLAGGVTTLILKDNKGKIVAKTQIPVQPKPPAIETPSVPTSDDFQLPSVGQAGRPIEVSGPFDGDIDTTAVKIGGSDVEVLAESPRKVVVQSPRDVVGPTEIEVKEANVVAKGEMNNLKVSLSADRTTLHKGEVATLGVRVSGLKGLQNPVPLILTNETPEVVNMQGGNYQVINITPAETQEEGTYFIERSLTAIQTGGFNIRAQIEVRKQKERQEKPPVVVQKKEKKPCGSIKGTIHVKTKRKYRLKTVVYLEGLCTPCGYDGSPETGEITLSALSEKLRGFQPSFLAIPKGSSLVIRSLETKEITHMPYVIPPVGEKTISLGLLERGETETLILSDSGVYFLADSIHKFEDGRVFATPNACFAVAKDDGTYTIEDLPPGKYTITVFTSPSRTRIPQAHVTVTAGKATIQDLTLTR